MPLVAFARDERPRANAQPVDFPTQVRPLFARACSKCHGAEKQRGGLRLDSRASVLKGGDSGEPAIVPGDPDASALLERVASDDPNVRMPPQGERLSARELALLKGWVAEGATWPENDASARVGHAAMIITAADREHWSFRPLKPSCPPERSSETWSRSPVDRFVFAALLSKRLTPAAECDRRTLMRRVTFDLAGLPPTPEEIAAFVHDDGPAAYERLVDRLLASPRYGERWGRHWLDLARCADSDGYEGDRDRKTAYRYRDFVIQALNADMPFDQFVRWQLAGDELAPDNPSAVVATGFCTAAPSQGTTPADTEENKAKIRYDELDNMLATTGSALLGLSVGCARCHDHKFDPIPTRDYYRMLAAFQTSERRLAPLSRPHRDLEHWLSGQRRHYREAKMIALGLTDNEKFWLRQPEHFFVPVQIELYRKYGKQLDPTVLELRGWMSASARAMHDRLLAAAAKAEGGGADPRATALALFDRGPQAQPAYLLGRGSVSNRQEAVTLGFLQVLTRGAAPEDYLAQARTSTEPCGERNDPEQTLGTTYQRTALSRWLTDVEHGAGALLARVIVNRLWQHHFGAGLVRTPDDFGATGDRPDHPELLEWLAGELIRGGWRLKPIHRQILLSAVYQQSTTGDPAGMAADADNRLLWHRRPTRLEAEPLRDAMLAACGRLNPVMYGPPFRPRIPVEAISTRSNDAYPADIHDGPPTWRRSVYAFVKRSVPNPLAEAFDAPDSTSVCGRRNTTAVPTQNLALLNDPFVRDRATDLARRVADDSGPELKDRIGRAYELALGRPPRDDELAAAVAFLSNGDGPDALADLCHVLFTLNEFLYID